MKNRLSKMGRKASWMFVLLAVCGVSSSCKDDYTLDDEKPSWLNSSIYESLESQGIYNNYLRLLGDADVNPANARPLTEVLSRTGSKTVFVADDDAWNAFYASNAALPASNPWHNATSYENLTVSQKKLLIHTSMLPNAIVMENLASNEGGGGKAVERGQYMRRYTDVEATDSITFVDGNSLPYSYSEGNGDKDYWARFRTENGGKGIYMVCDSTQSMMVHFTNEHMKNNSVSDNDFKIFMGRDRSTSDVHIYDALLTDKDAVCENGYINKTEKVLVPLANMAEVIRTNGKTNIFSHMLDRWSVPFYNRGVTEAYKKVMDARGITWTDSIFTKRYFSDNSFGKRALGTDPDHQKFRDAFSTEVSLKFDPGWNAYYDERAEPQYDMASMFVPNDETLMKYFGENGGGWQLIKTFYMKEGTSEQRTYEAPKTLDDLYKQIDQIPISKLRSLINVIMFRSFVGSVPSKMTQLRDDAQEPIFKPEHVSHIVDTKLACNGVVYITDHVWGPADYTSVAAPAYISNTNLIMNWAIYNGSTTATDYMKINYYAYLKAMQSYFTLFIPSDKGLEYYYDAVSFLSQRPRVVKMTYKDQQSFPIATTPSRFNAETGVIGNPYTAEGEKLKETEIVNRLKDILESHTIVLDETNSITVMNGNEETLVLNPEDEFFISKNGCPVRVIRDEKGEITKTQGGFQMANERANIIGEGNGLSSNNVTDVHHMNNGTTYILDSPIIPAAKSVFAVLTGSEDYSLFYSLCATNDSIVRSCGLVDEQKLTVNQQKTEAKKYQMFIDRDNPNSDKATAPDFNVEFFNNYRYTVFAPTNDAIQKAIDNGLPTWESIEEDWKSCVDAEGELYLTTEDSIRLQAKILYLINFLRYHFADNSVFVDHSSFSDKDMVTASYDNVKGLFLKVNTRRNNGVLEVRSKYESKDGNKNVVEYGDWRTVTGNYNIMARDITCSETPANKITMQNSSIEGSSFAVIHQIDGVMYQSNEELPWNVSTSACKKYIKKYAIR